ncbi:MAG: sortase [Patescibacteria group bacterium]
MSRSEIIHYLILRTIGNFLFLFAIFGVLATFGPAVFYEAKFRADEIRGIHYIVYAPQNQMTPFGKILEEQKSNFLTRKNTSFADILIGSKEQVLTPKDTEFSILIPKIGANVQVFPNVDPALQDEFLPILQKGIAHAKGTVFPGMPGNIYLFAHSTDNFWDVGRYNAVFYLLKDLSIGDQIVIFFENRRYNYKVNKTQITEPSDVSYFAKAQQGEETLILQTCWPPGTTWKRLLVFAKRNNSE